MVLLTGKEGNPIWLNPAHVVACYAHKGPKADEPSVQESYIVVEMSTDSPIHAQGELDGVASLIAAGIRRDRG